MKHTGHFALQRRVTSISTSVPRRRWRLHRPQLMQQSPSMGYSRHFGAVGVTRIERSHS